MSTVRLTIEDKKGAAAGHTHLRMLAFAKRTPRIIILAAGGKGINLHRAGGISISGVPAVGGTTLCWGELRQVVEEKDANPPMVVPPLDPAMRGAPSKPVPYEIDCDVRTFGPFMLRIGRDF